MIRCSSLLAFGVFFVFLAVATKVFYFEEIIVGSTEGWKIVNCAGLDIDYLRCQLILINQSCECF